MHKKPTKKYIHKMFKKITKHKNNKSIQVLITKIITKIKKKRQENNNKEHEGEGWRVAFKQKSAKQNQKEKKATSPPSP